MQGLQSCWKTRLSPKPSVKKKKSLEAFYKECGNVLSSTSHRCETQLSSWKVILAREVNFKGSHRTISSRTGLLQAEGIRFADWGSNSLYFYWTNLQTQTKSTEYPFQKKIVPISYCVLSLFQTLSTVNLLRIKAIYNSCQGKHAFLCWVNICQTHLTLSEVSVFMNHKTPKTPCPLTVLHGHHSTDQMRQLWRGNNKRRTIKANCTLSSGISFPISAP